MARLRLGVLASGRGSNLQALIEACRQPDHPAEIAVVICNIPGAPALARAAEAGIPTRTIPHKGFADRAAFDAAVDAALAEAGVGLVCLAGFMRILTPGFVARWRDRMVNIHPSLLPAFKGLEPQRQALDAGVRISGCTVHFVRDGTDEGPIIAQAAVPVLAGDRPDTLAARILAEEHRLYPLAVRLIAEDRVRVVDERVEIDRARAGGDHLRNPAD
ncbi:MAG: phosphoribosylglycinamide formyltransferase [Alphaproteobacteria bacterium]